LKESADYGEKKECGHMNEAVKKQNKEE